MVTAGTGMGFSIDSIWMPVVLLHSNMLFRMLKALRSSGNSTAWTQEVVGIEKTVGNLRERYHWPGHWRDVELFCKTCLTCNTHKTAAPWYWVPLQRVQAGYPVQLVVVDTVGQFPECNRVSVHPCGK